MSTITVISDDKTIRIDGLTYRFDFETPENLHAIQYDTNSNTGHIEWTGANNQDLTEADYDTQVAPYVKLYKAEQARIEKAMQEAEEQAKKEAEEAAKKAEEEAKAALEKYNSEEERFARLRTERNRRIAATDYLMASDYPISEEDKAKVIAYRQALRDLPAQEGAPWTDDTIPWPTLELSFDIEETTTNTTETVK